MILRVVDKNKIVIFWIDTNVTKLSKAIQILFSSLTLICQTKHSPAGHEEMLPQNKAIGK